MAGWRDRGAARVWSMGTVRWGRAGALRVGRFAGVEGFARVRGFLRVGGSLRAAARLWPAVVPAVSLRPARRVLRRHGLYPGTLIAASALETLPETIFPVFRVTKRRFGSCRMP